MDLFRPIDAYCERVDPSFWAEPVNALTNASFIIAAIWAWRITHGNRAAQILCMILAVIGVGSFLFHTSAQVWSMWADVIPIMAFTFFYMGLSNRDYLGLSRINQALAFGGFLALCAVMSFLVSIVPVIHVSAPYAGLPVTLILYGILLRPKHPRTGRGLIIGGAVLTVSLLMRSLDNVLCPSWPLGTHFLWHTINGVLLAWLIYVYSTHMLASERATG